MLREYLSSIANKFRDVLGTTKPINAQDFVDMIEETHRHSWSDGMGTGYNLGLEEGTEQGKPLGKLELLQNSEYMNAKVSGTAIAVNDVNSVEHSVGCNVASKNLLPYSRFSPTKTINGITFTNNGDGSITLNGTATAEAIFACIDETKAISLKAGTYTLIGGLNSSIWVQGKVVEDDSLSILNQDRKETFTFNYDFSFRFNIRVTSGTVCENVVIKPQLELGTTATEYTPYVADVGGIEVSRYGKNLFDSNNTYYGKGYFWNANTGVLVAGDPYYASPKIPINPNAQYTRPGVGVRVNIYFDKDGNFLSNDSGQSSIIPPSNAYYVAFNISSNISPDEVQVEIGTTATAYEPYIKPTTYQSTADGTVEGVKSISPNMTLLTNNNNVVINANYLRDIDTYIDNLKTNVALTGGE